MGSRKRSTYYEITSLNPEVTGSCHLVSVHFPNGRQINFVIDCGLFQEKAYNRLNDVELPFKGENIAFALVTHNHADHTGRLPYLVKSGFKGKIYASKETVRLMPKSLVDSFKIMKDNYKKKNHKCPYEVEDLEQTISSLTPCEFDQVEYVDQNIKVTFWENGHLPGAAIILVQISYPNEEDIKLIFTGDYKPTNRFFEVEEIPSWVYESEVVIVTESTYGYMDSTEIEYHIEKDFEEHLKAGYTIVCSAFAQQRLQEILWMLKVMQIQNRIDSNIPIRVDGNLGQGFCRLYATSELLIKNNTEDFMPKNCTFVTNENREEILNYRGQQIIITTSGMMDHGPAKIYLEEYIQRKNVLVYIPGYCSPDTLAYNLLHPENGTVRIKGKSYAVIAKVMTTNEFSSHAKADEIIEFLKRFKKLLCVLINHGQSEVKQQFCARVEEEVKTKRVEILGEHTFTMSHHGYMKHMGSKWVVPAETKKELEMRQRSKKAKKEKKPNKKCKKFIWRE